MPQPATDPPPADQLPFDSDTQRVFLHLWRTYDLLKAIEDECLSRFGLSAQQYNALRILRASHPQRLATMTLGRQMISRGPDITRLLDRLDQRGLIDRSRPVANRRTVQIAITAAGLRLLADIDQEVLQMHHKQLGHLSDHQQQQLVRLLKAARQPHESTGQGWTA